MRHPAPFSPLLAGLFVLAVGCAPADTDTDEAMPQDEAPADATMAAEEAIESLRADWVTHYNLHHPDMVADFYADSALILNADGAVDEGRDAVAARLTEAMAGSPTATVTTGDIMTFGDQGVAWGTYQVEATVEEQPMTMSGTYLGYFVPEGGEWKIAAMITNYDAPRPEGWVWAEAPAEAPPEESTMTEVITAFEEAFNQQQVDALAGMYADDAVVAYADGPVLRGRDAVAASFTERFGEGAVTIDVHGVGTMDLDATHRLDGGWYEMTDPASGQVVQTGMYMNLLEQAGDGSWQILWGVSNAQPPAAAAEM